MGDDPVLGFRTLALSRWRQAGRSLAIRFRPSSTQPPRERAGHRRLRIPPRSSHTPRDAFTKNGVSDTRVRHMKGGVGGTHGPFDKIPDEFRRPASRRIGLRSAGVDSFEVGLNRFSLHRRKKYNTRVWAQRASDARARFPSSVTTTVDIQVALISTLAAQRELVALALASAPGVLVRYTGADARVWPDQAVWPDVVVFGLQDVPKQTRSADWWRDLAWLRKAAPQVRLCLWFQRAEPEVIRAASTAGVKGLVQWDDATPASWATMVRVVSAGGSYWSRPFDVLGRWSRETVGVNAPVDQRPL